jgi:hypothetical protein
MSTDEELTIRNIIPVMDQLANYRAPLTLTWFFQGMLLTQQVRITTVFQDSVAFRTCDKSQFAPFGDCYVQINHQDFDWPVKAYLYRCSLDNCTFILSNFSYVERNWTDRSLDRLRPVTFTHVSFGIKNVRVIGSCLDLNTRGIGLLAAKKSYPIDQLLPGSSLHLDLILSTKYSWKKLEGTIVHISPISPLLFRVGILLKPNHSQAVMLEKYNSERKGEIIAELSRAFSRTLEPRQVVDLYF